MPQVHIGTFAFTVETVVLMGRTAHGSLFSRPSAHDRAVAHAVLERFGIAALANRPYTMISGGERQLVLLARALAQEPQFIVLDEPTASLDFGNQGKVMSEIRAWQNQGTACCSRPMIQTTRCARPTAPICCVRGRASPMGRLRPVLNREQLEALYRATVERLTDPASGAVAFLPG